MRWIKYDTYLETWQYKDTAGRVLAEIYCSHFEGIKGWTASDLTTVPVTPLGRYATREEAWIAVEKHFNHLVVAEKDR